MGARGVAAYLTHLDLGQSAGNGALMRCLPIALAYREPAKLEYLSHRHSKMTHYEELSSEACSTYLRIASRLLSGEALEPSIQLEVKGTVYESTLAFLPDCAPSRNVVHTFRWVLHILLNARSFSEVVQQAANLGGDSDTIGAIAGELVGIYYGYDQIPVRYADAIIIRNRLDLGVAEQLVQLRSRLSSCPKQASDTNA